MQETYFIHMLDVMENEHLLTMSHIICAGFLVVNDGIVIV